ncbi:unnamed protein product [Lactuca saligna]|uniref:Uncharacterized protein n=1 Tax=Lactuca saligna TaxID=75948 RepID=A0AA35YQJ9_LACSI|nr:unnamed protein product [Lactuca saligna]
MKMVVLLLNGTIFHKIVILTLLSTLSTTDIHKLHFFLIFFLPFCILFVCIFLMFTKRVNVDGNLVKKAVKLALNDLKEKNAGVLLSAHAVKIRSYAPELAKTIASLISSSNDLKFKGECASLLGLQSSHDDAESESIEDNIKQRLTSIIDHNDRQPQTNKRTRESAPLLFNDECFQEPEYAEDEEDDDEVSFSAFDL